jgi:ATP-dependent RNA helicase DDX27
MVKKFNKELKNKNPKNVPSKGKGFSMSNKNRQVKPFQERNNKKFNNKSNFRERGNKNLKWKKKNEEKLEEELTTENESNDFFDFDGDTNILSKLKSVKTKKSQNNSQIWNYKEVVEKENQIRKLKEAKMKEELKRQNEEDVDEMNVDEMQGEEIHIQKEENLKESPEDNFNANNVNKFESEVYSKDISFCDFNLSKLVLRGLANIEFFHPTKVQEKVIPIILKGNDVLINSETGSGKTACYLLPIIQKILTNKSSRSPIRSLVILPTRELAFQCGEMLKKFLKYLQEEIRFVSICGGMAIENQINELKSNPDIIIATPGRLIDMLYNYKSVNSSFLENINILVLDEADKLLELGFKDAIEEILSVIKNNQNRQTMLFSATLNTKIIDLGKDTLKNPIKVKMVKSAILTNLKQSIIRMKFKKVENDESAFEKRMAYLLCLLKDEKSKSRSIIFFNTKKECQKAFISLKKFDILSAQLHSDIPQPERLSSLDLFQNGKIPYLLCTDIAARGIDVEKLRFVINFQMPLMDERYVHRVGRTARKGYQGEAITICDDTERLHLKKLTKKENFTIFNISIDNSQVKKFYKDLLTYQTEITSQFENEQMDRELIAAERDVEKTINMKIHSEEIYNRPKKTWYMDKKEKKKLNKKMRDDFNHRKQGQTEFEQDN